MSWNDQVPHHTDLGADFIIFIISRLHHLCKADLSGRVTGKIECWYIDSIDLFRKRRLFTKNLSAGSHSFEWGIYYRGLR